MKKRSILSLALAAALLVLPLAGCTESGSESGGSDGDTIKIGGLAPLTGDLSQYGVAVNNAVLMAVDDINKNGGVLGKQIEYLPEDEKGDVTEAINAYNKLVSEGVVAIVGDVTSAPSKAVAQKANDDGMPIITASGTDAEITLTGEYAYRACFIDPYQGMLMATYASKELGAKTAAILYDSGDSYSTGIADAFEETAKELGMTVTNKEGYAHSSTDFNAQLTKIKASNPDVLMLPVYYSDVVLILKQAKQQGLDCQFLGADGWDGVVPQLNGDDSINDLLAKSYFCSQYSASSDDPDLQAFLTTYKEKYGIDANMFAVLGYDAMHILADAIERAGSTDAEAIIQAMSETNYSGLTGTTTFDENRNPVREAVITTFEDGAYKVLETYQA
ncbi:MAG TPA: ABC transporter substrate-binding protein [Firmicutes bacterium]|nr:ABC transporter substrate-binding protein [Bacillota bacterium]